MRKIAVVTGTRAEYGYLKPLMNEIEKDEHLELIPLVTGMHLLDEFGNTYKIVEKDFPNSINIPMKLMGDSLKDMAVYLSSGIENFANFFEKSNVDIVVVLGDRSEALAAALSALYLNIPIVHINGGDVTEGIIDEQIRHALTKISHIHFVHNKKNAERIKRMGEEEKRIFITGALTIDVIKNTKLKSKKEIFKQLDLNPHETTFLVVQHPITTLTDRGYHQFVTLFKVLNQLKKQTVLIYPNCDAGGKKIINLIKKNEDKSYLKIVKNLSHKDYLSLMKSADLMIGNSSSGIIEAPSLKVPVLNIGSRQQGRERSDNILDVNPKKDDIIQAINYVLNDKKFQHKVKDCNNKFGDGTASKKIVKILKEICITDSFIQKQLTY
ncbi:MAG: UDP-N-acetylglucosamine 2-epimerase [Candidatus Thermoplasmatota archaeon]